MSKRSRQEKNLPPHPSKRSITGRLIYFIREHKKLFRMYLFFGLALLALFGVVTLLDKTPFPGWLNRRLAHASGTVLRLIDPPVTVAGEYIGMGNFGAAIAEECNGIYATVILLAGFLAFPAPWIKKFIGVALGIVALQIINVVRIVVLFLIGKHFPSFFEASHLYVAEFVVIACGAGLWLLWYVYIVKP